MVEPTEPRSAGLPTLSVRQLILLLPLVPLLLLSYPLLVHFPDQLASTTADGLKAKLSSQAQLAAGIGPDLPLLKAGIVTPEDVQRRLAGLSSDPDVISAVVFDSSGKPVTGIKLDPKTPTPPLTGAERESAPEGLLVEGSGSLRLTSRLVHTVEEEEEEEAEGEGEKKAPKRAAKTKAGPTVKTVGWLRIDTSLDRVRDLAADQRHTGWWLGGIALVLGGLVAILLGTVLSRRIVAATRVVTEVAGGNLRVEVPEPRGRTELDLMFGALRQMVQELRELEAQAQAIGECDLSVRQEGEGDLSEAFRKMVDRQRELVQELSDTSTELESSSREILATLRQQEAGANDQASAVEEARRTMESLLLASKEITEAARAVHENAQRTKESSEGTAERASQLNGLTSRIGEVLLSITKIADKSDILALNAALEGTKAGEAGKGFILVAEEMRRLAESVKASVGDIRELVEDVRQASQSSVLATEQGVKLSLETTRSAELIRLTSQQQQSGTEQATHSMGEVTELIGQILSGARQNTSAVEEFGRRASRLQQLLSTYKIGDDHNGA